MRCAQWPRFGLCSDVITERSHFAHPRLMLVDRDRRDGLLISRRMQRAAVSTWPGLLSRSHYKGKASPSARPLCIPVSCLRGGVMRVLTLGEEEEEGWARMRGICLGGGGEIAS